MDSPQPPESPSPAAPTTNARRVPVAVDGQAAAWRALLAEMTELHARLEYLRVMLKLGVRAF